MLSKYEKEQISERMGEAAHNSWMLLRQQEKGWHDPDKCLEKEVITREDGRHCEDCHPCMRPYKDLPEDEKILDRQYPDLFLSILNDRGYEIVKKR